MTMLTIRDPLRSSPFRLLDEVVRGWGGDRVTGFRTAAGCKRSISW
jgi:hypothetical protein